MLNSLDSAGIPLLSSGETAALELDADLPNGTYKLFSALSADENLYNNTATITILRGPAGYPICITEIMFMPAGGEPEWVEVYNQSDEYQTIIGWEICDAVSEHAIPEFTIEPRGFAVLCEDTAIFSDSLCAGSILVEPYSWPLLNNDADSVSLRDNSDLTRFSIYYNELLMGVLGDCVDYGISAEVTEIGGSSVVCCPSGSTPGCDNAYWDVNPGELAIALSPNPFDPTKESATISLRYSEIGITVCLYDRMGRRIKTFCEPDGSCGFSVLWDGKDDDGKIFPVGMYILYIKDRHGNSEKSVIAIKGSR